MKTIGIVLVAALAGGIEGLFAKITLTSTAHQVGGERR